MFPHQLCTKWSLFLFVPQVTDDLFDEIATKVLSEDEMAGEGSAFSIFSCQFSLTFRRSQV